MSELAHITLDASIIEQVRAAALAYPDLKIRCPWCEASHLGKLFTAHLAEHETAREPAPDWWMAL